MTAVEAIVLGLLQGLTEFLPISSTAHLTIAGRIFGLITPANAPAWTAFLAVVQLGTLVAVILFFFRELAQMPLSLFQDLRSHGLNLDIRRYSPNGRAAILIIVGTVPIGIVGLFLSDFLHGVFTKNLVVIASSLIVLAGLLWLAERIAGHVRQSDDLNVRDAVLIGAAQCLALIPGSSRSGTTITAGLFLNLTRYTAARFSFLLSIPAVFASGIHELLSLDANPFHFGTANVILAIVVSAISGYASIAWLLRFLMKRSTMAFVWYRIGLGLLIFVLVSSGIPAQ